MPTGQQVILRLFIALAIATAATLLYFSMYVEPEHRTRVYIALAGNLLLALVVYLALRAIGKRKAPVDESLMDY